MGRAGVEQIGTKSERASVLKQELRYDVSGSYGTEINIVGYTRLQ